MNETNFGDFAALLRGPRKFVARGVIAPHGANYTLVGQYTYLSLSAGWPVWDGDHKAAAFATSHAAIEAAHSAKGPLFRMPSPETIEAVDISAIEYTRPAPL